MSINGPFTATCITATKLSWSVKEEFIKQYLLAVLSSNGQYWESESIIKHARQSWELIHGE